MKTETCKLYPRVFLIFLPNFIKIDLDNFELYRFKVGAFLGHSVVLGGSLSAELLELLIASYLHCMHSLTGSSTDTQPHRRRR